MQVSQIQDHVTHAVISGHKTIDFGISNSAEFFNILSSTLYKDQILAVVRETICNAWDAHIEAGITAKPIEITLTPSKLTITDHGKGIALNDMGEIYGTYGNSTKKNDGKQTGGFGLGCKAPFAYTDHFEVTSCNQGTKTIYALSKSSAQTMGKPGITPIVSLPTEETGLTVSIPIRNHDLQRFTQVIKQVLFNGDINAIFNGNQVTDLLGFDTSKSSFIILKDVRVLDEYTRIYVRYGNVIYPVYPRPDYRSIYTEIDHFLKKLQPSYSSDISIIFQAPPHSISVTPSREALSMQEHTIKTVYNLLSAFSNKINTEFVDACMKEAEKSIDAAISEKSIGKLLNPQRVIPITVDSTNESRMTDISLVARDYLNLHYPEGNAFRKKDITYRIKKMAENQLLDRGLAQKYLKYLNKAKTIDASYHTPEHRRSFVSENIITPLVLKLLQTELSTEKLFVFSTSSKNNLIPFRNFQCYDPAHSLPYLRTIVVLTTRLKDLYPRICRHPDYLKLGASTQLLVYKSGIKKGELQAAQKFFAQQNVYLIDLTQQSEEHDVINAPPKVKKPILKGLPSLKTGLKNTHVDLHCISNSQPERILAPEFIVKLSTKRDAPQYELDIFDRKLSAYIMLQYGDKGGAVFNEPSFAKWKANGAKELIEYLSEKIVTCLLNNPSVQEAWSFNFEKVSQEYRLYGAVNDILEVVYSHKELRQELGVRINLSHEEEMHLQIYNRMKIYRSASSILKPVDDWLNQIPLDPVNEKIVKLCENAPLLDLLNHHRIKSALNSSDPKKKEKTIEILLSVLKG